MTVLDVDRTKELREIAENVKQKLRLQRPPNQTERQPPQRSTTSPTRTQFTLHASHIARAIYETSEKLAKLTKLTKHRVDFDEEEVAALTMGVKNDLRLLNKEIEALRESLGKRGNKSNQPQRHTEQVVQSLHSHLQETTSEFKAFLENRTDHLKEQHKMSMEYTGKPGRPRRTQPSLHFTEPKSAVSMNGDVSITMPPQSTLQQQQLRQFDYAKSRVHAIQSVEETIHELHGMFQQLGTLVAEQQDTIDRIDLNVSETMNNMVGVEGELLKYLAKVTSNRWLIVKIFLVLIIFIIIFIVLFV